MPTPKKGENKQDFINRCIPILVDEGREQTQAVAICYSIFDNFEKKNESTTTANLSLAPSKLKFDEIIKSMID